MHHFTLRKMKNRQPGELGSLIEKFIINSDRPSAVPPKQRAARGSRKRRDQMTFTRNQLERMLNLARLSGDKEMVSMLAPKKSLAICKRELISSIRHGKVEPELWNGYVESLNAQQNAAAAISEMLSLYPSNEIIFQKSFDEGTMPSFLSFTSARLCNFLDPKASRYLFSGDLFKAGRG